MYINETPFDSALIKEMGKRYHFTIIPYTLLLSGLMLLLGIFNLIRDNTISGVIFSAFSVLVLIAFHIVLPVIIKSRAKEDPKTKEIAAQGVVQTITFNEDHFSVTSTLIGDNPVRNSYDVLHKIIRTRKYIIFDIIVENGTQSVSLGLLKSGMIVGEANDLYKFLKKEIERNKRSK